MVVVLDSLNRPRHPEKVAPARPAGCEKAGLDQRQGAGVAGLCRDARDRARERAAYRVRGGRLPEYRRVLGEEARDLHDHGRHLHARLRVLQRQDRPARRARSGGACARRARPPPSSGLRMSSSPRSTATISTTAARRHFAADHPRHPRALPDNHDRGADARFPAQGRRGWRRSSRRSRTCSTTISKRCRRTI